MVEKIAFEMFTMQLQFINGKEIQTSEVKESLEVQRLGVAGRSGDPLGPTCQVLHGRGWGKANRGER